MLDIFQKVEKTKERDIKPKTIKAGSLPRKQNKCIPQNKKILKNVAASVFGLLSKKYLYNYNNNYNIIHTSLLKIILIFIFE